MAIIVVEHPNTVIISDALMSWSRVVEPVVQVVEHSFVSVNDVLLPGLFIVALWVVTTLVTALRSFKLFKCLIEAADMVQVIRRSEDLVISFDVCYTSDVNVPSIKHR